MDSNEDQRQEQAGEDDWSTETVWAEFKPKHCKNESFASTIDIYPNMYYSEMLTYQPDFQLFEKQKYYDPSIFIIQIENIGRDPRTTLMIKNIPNKYTIQHLADEIDEYHENSYDFLYLPCDIKVNQVLA